MIIKIDSNTRERILKFLESKGWIMNQKFELNSDLQIQYLLKKYYLSFRDFV